MNNNFLFTMLLIFTESALLGMEDNSRGLLIKCGNYMHSVPKETEIILPNNRNKAYKPPVKTLLSLAFKNPEQAIHINLLIEGCWKAIFYKDYGKQALLFPFLSPCIAIVATQKNKSEDLITVGVHKYRTTSMQSCINIFKQNFSNPKDLKILLYSVEHDQKQYSTKIVYQDKTLQNLHQEMTQQQYMEFCATQIKDGLGLPNDDIIVNLVSNPQESTINSYCKAHYGLYIDPQTAFIENYWGAYNTCANNIHSESWLIIANYKLFNKNLTVAGTENSHFDQLYDYIKKTGRTTRYDAIPAVEAHIQNCGWCVECKQRTSNLFS